MIGNSHPQAAPEPLERVRILLNSWSIPNDTRVPQDNFDTYIQAFGDICEQEATVLRQLRDDLRVVVEGCGDAVSRLEPWLERLEVRPTLYDVGNSVGLTFTSVPGKPGELLKVVLEAIIDGTWPRLKACPDCRWVFFDHTRNASKRWCGMYAGGPTGRACGTIAKVKRHRQKRDHGE